MKTPLLLFLVSLILSTCSSSNHSVGEDMDESWKVYYFDFDEVDHYHTTFNNANIDGLEIDSTDEDEHRDYLHNIFSGGIPKTITDTAFIDDLPQLQFVKTDIPESKNEAINDLFREKSFDPNESKWMCMPEYRDILIFRKNHQITGIAKVCFGCNILSTRGTEANTEYFGSQKGFQKLRTILYEELE